MCNVYSQFYVKIAIISRQTRDTIEKNILKRPPKLVFIFHSCLIAHTRTHHRDVDTVGDNVISLVILALPVAANVSAALHGAPSLSQGNSGIENITLWLRSTRRSCIVW